MWEGLWRRTVTLLREYPVLWLPVMFADAAGFAVKSSQPVVTSYLLQFLFRGRSILGFKTVDHSTVNNTFAYVLAVTLTQIARFTPIVLYAAAFLITARLARERTGMQWEGRRRLVSSALLLSLRVYLIAIPLSFVLFIPLAFTWPRWPAIFTHWLVAYLIGLLLMFTLAYLMVPVALRALTSFTMPQAGRGFVRLGRKFAIAAVIASTGLLILEHVIGGAIHANHSQLLVIQGIMSLIAALPYVPLYVALTLLTGDEQTYVTEEHVALVPRDA